MHHRDPPQEQDLIVRSSTPVSITLSTKSRASVMRCDDLERVLKTRADWGLGPVMINYKYKS